MCSECAVDQERASSIKVTMNVNGGELDLSLYIDLAVMKLTVGYRQDVSISYAAASNDQEKSPLLFSKLLEK